MQTNPTEEPTSSSLTPKQLQVIEEAEAKNFTGYFPFACKEDMVRFFTKVNNKGGRNGKRTID